MRVNIYKPINNTRVIAAFYNGSSTEQNAILKWLREPYDTPYVPPMINTRDLRNLEIWVPGKRDRRHEVEPGDVIVRDIDTGELTIVPRDEFVQNNAPRLVETLGMGRHFGEWAGTGIQRGYAIEKTFFLFDPWRYDQDLINDHNLANESTDDPCLDTVPVLWQGKVLNLTEGINISIGKLLTEGSHVGYATPEGLVVRAGAQVMWKLILEPDGSISETPKGVQ